MRVTVRDSRAYLVEYGFCGMFAHAACWDVVEERAALHQLHTDVRTPMVPKGVLQTDDVGVREAAHHLYFAT